MATRRTRYDGAGQATEHERGLKGWAQRCEYGPLGNRKTCACVFCGRWREEDAARNALYEAQVGRERTRIVRRQQREKAARAFLARLEKEQEIET